MEDELRASLRASYGSKARKRDLNAVQPWKEEERLRFLALLRSEEARTLLELGAGPGKDGEFFVTVVWRWSAQTCRPRWSRCARARVSRRV